MGGVITQSIFFYATYDVISTILSIPLSYYFTFVLEEKHGFNRSTLGLWISDTITNLAISLVLSVPFAALSLQITDYFGDSFVVYCMIFCMVWMCVVMTVLPSIVSPIFNKFTPIQDEKLKLAIEDLTKKVGFPLDKMYIEDQSKRTGHSNVYITGMPWSKRIIITDTFIDYSTIDEIVAALAHELGHWKMNHVPKRIISYQPQFFVMFTLFSAFIHNRSFYSSFGFADIQPTIIGFYLFYDIYSPVNLFMHFLNNLLSRHQESAADLYAKDLGYVESLCTSLIKISNENLSTFDDVDWLFSAYYRSYPTIAERLTALNYISEGNVSEESK
ncbi:peptidase family M48-domain-containing protein [Scheffersomyces xylosifermentans]|uniref:peptidase family M48-domain-containing protein n=1 Tax=Scheffersomyces xylosifermentans TaxID=1304137 RepID=UPI00315DAF9D